MFKIRHDIETGEWGETHVEIFCEAVNSFRCKLSGKSAVNILVTFYHGDKLIKTVTLQ